jgi:hypothetical protein
MLPRRDFSGEYRLVAYSGEKVIMERTVRFQLSPATERFKPVSDPTSWYIEDLFGSVTANVVRGESPTPYDAGPWAEREAFLGRDVGEFVTSPDEATWIVSAFGDRRSLRRGLLALDHFPFPEARPIEGSQQRRWRKLFLHSGVDPNDVGAAAARQEIRSLVTGSALPKEPFPDIPCPITYRPSVKRPDDGVHRLVSILAGQASARAGIPARDWRSLLARVFGIDGSLADQVTRAWVEAGYLDDLLYARWRSRSFFPRKPVFASFRVRTEYGAVLTGMALESTKESIRGSLRKLKLPWEERFAFSSFVPSTIALRAENFEQLGELLRRTGIEARWVDLDWRSPALDEPLDCHGQPPQAEMCRSIEPWSLDPSRQPEEIGLQRCWRRGRPDHWVATGTESVAWSYFSNVARWKACVMAGVVPVEKQGAFELRAINAYLPLPLARKVSLLGPALPGPNPDSPRFDYRYAFSSSSCRDEIFDFLVENTLQGGAELAPPLS